MVCMSSVLPKPTGGHQIQVMRDGDSVSGHKHPDMLWIGFGQESMTRISERVKISL